MKELYTRYLPHWHPQDRWIFITWKLAGTYPRTLITLPPDLSEGNRFALLDREADRATTGPLWLSDQRIARIVKGKIISLEGEFYDLAAWVIMPNHVHIVILPKYPVRKIMQRLKGSTAHDANEILGRTGQFWAVEFYDHWIRSEDEFNRVVRYVERNPVNAGLVESAEQWLWSSTTQTKVRVTSEPLALF